jgi:predicted  nucleic acid-binding Zn-ribbon protein
MKGIQHIYSIRDIKSIHSAGTRSIPRIQRSDYLKIYMLKREKDRLEKEIFALDKRRNAANRQLNSINKRIEKLQEETGEGEEIKTSVSSAGGLKKMTINY